MEVNFIYKIVAVGAGGVGKTSIIRRFALNKFETSYVMTLGVDFTTKQIVLSNNTPVKIVCVDTAGQEYYSRIRPTYYSGGNGALIVFDLCNRTSFESLPKWIDELSQHLSGVPIAIVGNKLDLADGDARRVQIKEADEFAIANGAKYFETSAKLGSGIEPIFLHLSEIIHENLNHSSN